MANYNKNMCRQTEASLRERLRPAYSCVEERLRAAYSVEERLRPAYSCVEERLRAAYFSCTRVERD